MDKRERVAVQEMPLLEIAKAMQELLARPMGVVPACADKFYDSNTGDFTAELVAHVLAARDARIREAAMETAISVAASLAAAISLLENGGKNAAPSDRMFEQMLKDYRKSLDDFRALIAKDKANG